MHVSMWKILHLCVILSLITFLEAAVGIQPYVPKPSKCADQEGCYSPQLELVLPYNKPYTPTNCNSCTKYLCRSDNTTLIESCGAIGYDTDKCTLTKDYTQAYPCCCGTLKCDDGHASNVGGRNCEV